MTGYEFLMRMKMEGVTGSEIADKLKISPQAVYKWTADKDKNVKIPAKHWNEVANILRIPIGELIPGGNIVSGNITATNGSVAQQSGGDSVANLTRNSTNPVKQQLISLIHEVATDEYCKREISRLQEAARILSGHR